MEKAVDKKQNCLTLIRYIAALNVFWFHAVAHLNVKMPEPLNLLMKCVQGVPVFFVISGFLIWMSLDNTSSFSIFLKKRVFRLYPELWGGGIP